MLSCRCLVNVPLGFHRIETSGRLQLDFRRELFQQMLAPRYRRDLDALERELRAEDARTTKAAKKKKSP